MRDDLVEIIIQAMRSEGEQGDPDELWELAMAEEILSAIEQAGFVVVPTKRPKNFTIIEAIDPITKQSTTDEANDRLYALMLEAATKDTSDA